MKRDLKQDDVFNRRQQERPLKLGIHDISCARYFTIGEEISKYTLTWREFERDYAVYHTNYEGSTECVGYAIPERNKIIIKVHRNGLNWSCKIALSDIKIFGNKSPQH